MQRLTLETRKKRYIGALLGKNLHLCLEMQSAGAYGANSPHDRLSQSNALQVYYRDHNGENESAVGGGGWCVGGLGVLS